MQSSYPGIRISFSSFITDDNVHKKFINFLCHKPTHKLLLWNCQEKGGYEATTTTTATMGYKPTTRNYSQEI
jgi:hypothetical protein